MGQGCSGETWELVSVLQLWYTLQAYKDVDCCGAAKPLPWLWRAMWFWGCPEEPRMPNDLSDSKTEVRRGPDGSSCTDPEFFLPEEHWAQPALTSGAPGCTEPGSISHLSSCSAACPPVHSLSPVLLCLSLTLSVLQAWASTSPDEHTMAGQVSHGGWVPAA